MMRIQTWICLNGDWERHAWTPIGWHPGQPTAEDQISQILILQSATFTRSMKAPLTTNPIHACC